MTIYTRKIVFALFYCIFIPQAVLSEINRDLELEALYNHINHTTTRIGAEQLHHLLANPTNDIQILKNRQSIITQIVEDKHLHAKLSIVLKSWSTHEKDLKRLYQPSTEIEAAFLQDLYFSHDSLQKYNHNPLYLELGQMAYFGNLCSSLVQHSLAFAIFTWGLEEEHVCAVHPAKKHVHKHKTHHHEHDAKKDHTPKKHSHKHEMCSGSSCTKSHQEHDHHHDCHHHQSHNPLKALAQSPSFRYAFQLWHGIAQIQELYSIQLVVRNHLKGIVGIQTQLMGVAHGLRTLRQLYNLLEQYPDINEHISHYQNLKNICLSTNISPKLATCLRLLQTKTFKGKPSSFSRIGIILATYRLLQEVAGQLQPAFNAVGQIDAYVNCAQLVKNHQSGPMQYSFAHYTTDTRSPHISAHNMWHPLSKSETIQLNSIELGLPTHPRNIIITGPNASGKSTNLKTITLCAYLAQTLTIVPAQEYTQTMYKEIYSSMIVTDNISENMSLFAAELHNAEELLSRVENLKEDEYMLVVLDELFKSTHHEKGKNVAYRLLQHLYQSPQVISIVSTHFENLSSLADIPQNNCANYTLQNFKLIPGIGFPDNAFDVVKKQTKSRLLNEASDF